MVSLSKMQMVEFGYFADVNPRPKPSLRTIREFDKSVLPKQYHHGMYVV